MTESNQMKAAGTPVGRGQPEEGVEAVGGLWHEGLVNHRKL